MDGASIDERAAGYDTLVIGGGSKIAMGDGARRLVTGKIYQARLRKSMNDGKQDELQPGLQNESIPEPYLGFARWLYEHPNVLEVWGMVSDLPEISIPEASVTLDAGTWFLCRLSLPPIPNDGGIISFVRRILK